jgi:hypothetical protein
VLQRLRGQHRQERRDIEVGDLVWQADLFRVDLLSGRAGSPPHSLHQPTGRIASGVWQKHRYNEFASQHAQPRCRPGILEPQL